MHTDAPFNAGVSFIAMFDVCRAARLINFGIQQKWGKNLVAGEANIYNFLIAYFLK